MEPAMSALAYFITYGSWLHGRETGSVDRNHNLPGTPFLPPDREIENQRFQSLRQPPYDLDDARRDRVLRTICEVAKYRRWKLWAVHVRTLHVHIVVTAPDPPEKVMSDFKAWASRRLRENFDEPRDRDRWTQHGSTRWLNDEISVESTIEYVVDRQGVPMSVFDGRLANEPDA